MNRRVVRDARGEYQIFLPRTYAEDRVRWPLILFLHGGGERGTDIEKVKVHGPLKIAAQRPDFPFIVVAPQVDTNLIWSTARLDALLDDVQEKYRVDLDRIYVTGLSMGGYGAWHLVAAHPNRFAAAVPICGGGEPEMAKSLARVPIWAFHGAKDTTVPLAIGQKMVDQIKQAGGDVQFTIYPDVGHDSWKRAYADEKVYDWLLAHRRK